MGAVTVLGKHHGYPTCATGFWEPLHEGCPVCGPNGPCVDPEYEAMIQANLRKKRRRAKIENVLLICLSLIAVAAISYGFARMGEPQAQWFWCDVAGLCS